AASAEIVGAVFTDHIQVVFGFGNDSCAFVFGQIVVRRCKFFAHVAVPCDIIYIQRALVVHDVAGFFGTVASIGVYGDDIAFAAGVAVFFAVIIIISEEPVPESGCVFVFIKLRTFGVFAGGRIA